MFNLLQQRLRRIAEQEMRLVEEEDQDRLVRITDLGQLLKQLGQQEEQKCRVEPRRLHELIGGKDADIAPPVPRGPHQVYDVQGWLAEEMIGTLLFKHKQ